MLKRPVLNLNPPRLSRRQLMGLTGGALAAGALRPNLLSAGSTSERKFLFFFCQGGWDVLRIFAPLFNYSSISMEADATTAEIDGITFVDHASRPSVRSFFENYASRSCMFNGFEVRSIAHERCQRLLFTGRGDSGLDDWPTIIAANSANNLLLPHMVLSGPAFSSQYSSSVVRMGLASQLPNLINATTNFGTTPLSLPTADVQALEDAFVQARLDSYLVGAGAGRTTRFGEKYLDMVSKMDELAALGPSLTGDIEVGGATCGGVWDQCGVAMNLLEMGVSRCVMIGYQGSCSATFDTHSDDQRQATHIEEAFQHINWMMQELASRTGSGGGSLLDEVTVVICSEMGRHPQLNTHGGRDHWTFTSALLAGAGIQGGQVVGGFNEYAMGQLVDLSSGQVSDSGTSLLSAHFGATLLALADIDPGEYITDGAPVESVIA